MLISVVIPTRNSAATLERCLRSIREQVHTELELVVVDNHSTDETQRIAQAHADRVVLAGPERSAQRNRGAESARGDGLIFIDSDMILEPGVVGSCADLLAQGNAGVVIPERSIGVGFWSRCKALERACYVGDDSIEAARCFSRSAFDQVGGYDETILAGPEDWDMSQRVAERFGAHGRCAAWIDHDEGHLTLAETVRTKFYYGRSSASYVARHRTAARRQVLRPAFLRHPRLLARQPLTAVGMLTMKGLEYIAGGAGLLVSLARRH